MSLRHEMPEEDGEASTGNSVRLHFVARPILQELSRLDLSGCLDYSDANAVVAGGFADIIKGQCMCENRGVVSVAIKRLRFYMKEDIKKLFEKEIYVWSKLKHANILPLLGYDFDKVTGYPLLVSEWMDNGSILNYVKSNPQVDLLSLVVGVAHGLAYLHENLVVHSDIKSDNILVSASGNPLICDFGCARMMAASQSLVPLSSTRRGTYCYLARELLTDISESSGHTIKTDVWAFGMTVFELLARQRPYSPRTEIQVLVAIQNGELPAFPTLKSHHLEVKVEEALKDVCRSCWRFDPTKRPVMSDIVTKLESSRFLTLSAGSPLVHPSDYAPENVAPPSAEYLKPTSYLQVTGSVEATPVLQGTSTSKLPTIFVRHSQDALSNRRTAAALDKDYQLLSRMGNFQMSLSNLSQDSVQKLIGRFERLSIEAIVRILVLLDFKELLTVSCLNHFFHKVVMNFPEVQFSFALKTYGMVDRDGSLDVRRTLEELERRERAWRTMDLSRKVTVKVPHWTSNIYELSGGIFMTGDCKNNVMTDETRSVRFFDLRTCTSSDAFRSEPWPEIKIDANIVDFGVALDEFDLVAVVGIMTGDKIGRNSIIIVLRELSTGAPHPLARNPSIVVDQVGDDRGNPSIVLEIVGPRLLLLLTWHEGVWDEQQKLLLYNWWDGGLVALESAPQLTWSSFAFLSSELVLLTGRGVGLEIIRLPDVTNGYSSRGFERVLRLSLPSLQPSTRLGAIQCRAEPNPLGRLRADKSSSETAQEYKRAMYGRCPVAPDPTKALVFLRIDFDSLPQDFVENEPYGHYHICLIVHRDFLLRLAEDFTNAPTAAADDPQNIANHVGDAMCIPTVPWVQWSSNARLMVDKTQSLAYITSTAGQRYVGMDIGGRIVVRDFNPISVQRARSAKAAARPSRSEMHGAVQTAYFDDQTWNSGRVIERYGPSEDRMLRGFFAELCEKPLACVEYISREEYAQDVVLMDDERIIGLYLDETFMIAELHVFTL